ELVGQHLEYAIGLKSAVADDTAIAMAKGFYGALSATGRVSTAVRAARANLHLMSSGGVELYCAKRTPGFRGFVADTRDPAVIDPELYEQLTRLDRLVEGHITVPIVQGARSATDSPTAFSPDKENGGLVARFTVPCPVRETLAFYERWGKCDGWFIEPIST